MEALQAELASLVRVRNRLAHSPDAALPKILTGLLPRLANHLDVHTSALEELRGRRRLHDQSARRSSEARHDVREDAAPRQNGEVDTEARRNAGDGMDEELALRTKLQEHVSGIFMHALERIRGGIRTFPSGAAPWMPPLLQKLQEQQTSSEPWTDVTVAFVLSLLQASLPYCKADTELGGREESQMEARAERQRQYLSMLSSLGWVVDGLRRSLLQDVISHNNARIDNIRPGNRRNGGAPPLSSKELNHRSAAWLCLDLLALSRDLPLLIDWDRDHFDEYGWKSPAPAEQLHRILHEAEHAVADHDTGLSLAALDLMNSRRDRSRQRAWNVRYLRELKCSCVNQIVEVLRTESASTSVLQGDRTAMQRALLLCIIAGSPSSMHGKLALQHLNKSHRHWKCRHGPRTSVKASSVIACGKGRSKGKGKPPASENRRPPAPKDKPSSPQCPYDLTFASSLLVLVLGERASRPILEKHADEGAKIKALLGPTAQPVGAERDGGDAIEQEPSAASDAEGERPLVDDPMAMEMEMDPMDDREMNLERMAPAARHREGGRPPLGQRNHPTNHNQMQSRLRRAPMPFGVVERVIDFILTQLLPKDLPEGFVDLTNSGGGHIVLTATNEEEWEALELFVKLVLALKDQKGKVGSYWAIQLIDGIRNQFPPLKPASDSPRNTMCIDDDTADDSRSRIASLHQSSLDIAAAVLSHIAQVEAEGQQLLEEMEHRQDQGRRVLGVPGPFRDRRDLNTLLADHRVSQRKRQLRADCALQARETAYGIVTELAPQVVTNRLQQLKQSTDTAERKALSSELFDIPIVLLRCAVGEVDVGMHPSLTRAVDALLEVFTRFVESEQQALSEAEIAPLLPSLLCAVCADSSAARLGAAKWAIDFISWIDPPVSSHICTHLADDGDPLVAAVAKKGLSKFVAVVDVVMKDHSASAEVAAELSMEEDKALVEMDLNQKVHELALALDLPPSAARVVLGHCGFDAATALKEVNSDRNKMLSDYGVVSRCGRPAMRGEDDNGERLCEICYDEVGAKDLFSMPCEHEFCRSCWRGYLSNNLQAWSRGLPSITCPEQNCMERVAKEDVAAVAPGLVSQWNDIELRSFVDGDCCYSKCPGPDCTIIVRSNQSRGTTPTSCSKCKSTFCFACRSAPHQPAHCADFAKWSRIFADSDIWIKKHAKPCPGCDVPIEKNDGCNHMHCSRCNTDFCWLCLGPLGNDHFEPHICNRYLPEEGASNEHERRALFFSGRYEAHDSAAMFANDHAKAFAEKREKLAAETLWFLSDDDLDLSERALRTLVEARNFLRYSYVAAWAMSDKSDVRDRFEGYQANLELFTEQLSWLLLMTKLHTLYTEGGGHAIHLHFRAVSFSTASTVKYMGRILALLDVERER